MVWLDRPGHSGRLHDEEKEQTSPLAKVEKAPSRTSQSIRFEISTQFSIASQTSGSISSLSANHQSRHIMGFLRLHKPADIQGKSWPAILIGLFVAFGGVLFGYESAILTISWL